MAEKKTGFLRLEKGRVDGFGTMREMRLSSDVTVIGRPGQGSSDPHISEVHVDDDYVSRGHMRIVYDYSEQCHLAEERDGGTQNGTYLNGDKIESGRVYRLRDGDKIGLAMVGEECRVVFRFRETQATLLSVSISSLISSASLSVDLQARKVSAGSRTIPLRRKEFDLLAYLYKNSGKACSRNEIAQQVWADEGGIVAEETIDTVIHRIREKIEADPSKPRFLVTLPRYGFRLDL